MGGYSNSLIFTPRPARLSEVQVLVELITLTSRDLLADVYTHDQIESALGPVFGVDEQLIADGTYYVIDGPEGPVACGGWSFREAAYGGRAPGGVESERVCPETGAARLRAFFVHPDFARQGLGSAIVQACEKAIVSAGFGRCEIAATLAGEPLYRHCGYATVRYEEIELAGAPPMRIAIMAKSLKIPPFIDR